MSGTNHESLVKAYLHLRDVKLKEENRRHKDAKAAIQTTMNRIEQIFLSEMNMQAKSGNAITSIITESGRATKVTRTSLSLYDPTKLRMFILDDPSERMELLQNRLHETGYGLFVKENPDIEVPGISSEKVNSITISKPTKRD